MWFRNPEDVEWHYLGGVSDSKARRLACGRPLFIKPGTQKSPQAGQPACARCVAAADRLARPPRQRSDAEDSELDWEPHAPRRAPHPAARPRPAAPRPQPLAPAPPRPITPPPAALPEPQAVTPKPSYRWVRENANSIWHYLASSDAPGPICGAVGVFPDSRYNLPSKVERCPRCGQESARITRARVLQKRGGALPDTTPQPAGSAPAAHQSVHQPVPLPPVTAAADPDSRLEQIAAAGRRLSHLIEKAPDKPFPQVFAQLSRPDQEIITLAMHQRIWSDLFLSPTAQKAARAAREASRPPTRASNAALARNKRRSNPDRRSDG